MECTKPIAFLIQSVDPTIHCRRSILLRRCIFTTRVESRDSPMECTKPIAFLIQSVDRSLSIRLILDTITKIGYD